MLVETKRTDIELLRDAFRRQGHFEADLDPLGRLQPEPQPELHVEARAVPILFEMSTS